MGESTSSPARIRVGGVAGEVAARVAPPQVEQVAHSSMLEVDGQGGQLHGGVLGIVEVVVGVQRDGSQARQRGVVGGRRSLNSSSWESTQCSDSRTNRACFEPNLLIIVAAETPARPAALARVNPGALRSQDLPCRGQELTVLGLDRSCHRRPCGSC